VTVIELTDDFVILAFVIFPLYHSQYLLLAESHYPFQGFPDLFLPAFQGFQRGPIHLFFTGAGNAAYQNFCFDTFFKDTAA
jgi:hypothetical protein